MVYCGVPRLWCTRFGYVKVVAVRQLVLQAQHCRTVVGIGVAMELSFAKVFVTAPEEMK